MVDLVLCRLRFGFYFALGAALGGCAFGPKTLESAHTRYNESIKSVSDEELLLNLVRLRYNETVLQLEVSNVAAQYEAGASLEARPFFSTEGVNLVPPDGPFGAFSRILPFVGASLTDRPTFSFHPVDDADAVKQLFVPATLDGIIFLAETSWPISTVFSLFVESINRLPNAPSESGPARGVEPEFREFQRAMQLMQGLQDARKLKFVRTERVREVGGPLPQSAVDASALIHAAKDGFEYRQRDDRSWMLVKLDRQLELRLDPAALGSPELTELCQLLNLEPGRTTYEITIGGDTFATTYPPPTSRGLHIVPRSTVQALFYLSNGIDLPNAHLCAGVVAPSPDSSMTDGLFKVHSDTGHQRPKCAYLAVKYRGRWFYIDDRDAVSKATFGLMKVMSRINLLGPKRDGPSLTLPVGR